MKLKNEPSSQINNLGWIELITGCMFAGKTEEFIRRLKRYAYAKKNIISFKPIIDDRYSKDSVASHSGMLFPSFAVYDTKELKKILVDELKTKKINVIGIDEVQFFDEEIVNYIEELANQGFVVIVTGLDKDFKNEPFKNVDKLLPMAEFVDKLTAICVKCGNFANKTQRIINNEVASWSSPLILVDGNDSYEARCRNCYIVKKEK